jgi:hypothetical protein
MSDFQWLGVAVLCLGVGVLLLAVWGRLIARQINCRSVELSARLARLERNR